MTLPFSLHVRADPKHSTAIFKCPFQELSFWLKQCYVCRIITKFVNILTNTSFYKRVSKTRCGVVIKCLVLYINADLAHDRLASSLSHESVLCTS